MESIDVIARRLIEGLKKSIAGKEDAFSKNSAFNKNFGTEAGTVCEGNDSRLSNSRPANGGNADTVDNKHASDFATASQGSKADAALPASSYTADDILTKIKSIDGSGSGLDSDKVDGYHILTGNFSGNVSCTTAYGSLYYGSVTVDIGKTLSSVPRIFTDNNSSGVTFIMVKSSTRISTFRVHIAVHGWNGTS
jgi:hypothetical protein